MTVKGKKFMTQTEQAPANDQPFVNPQVNNIDNHVEAIFRMCYEF